MDSVIFWLHVIFKKLNPVFKISVGTRGPVGVDLVGVLFLQCNANPRYVTDAETETECACHTFAEHPACSYMPRAVCSSSASAVCGPQFGGK